MGEFKSARRGFGNTWASSGPHGRDLVQYQTYVDEFRFRWASLGSHGRDMVVLHRCSISNASMLCGVRD